MLSEKLSKYCEHRTGTTYKKEGSLLTWLDIRCKKTGEKCDCRCFNEKLKESKNEKADN